MATFVLVNGAFAGAWAWQQVRAAMSDGNGHRVVAPTLTGLGDRVHLSSRSVDLETHVQDVVNVLFYEDLREVILVGASYGGMVITGVADRARERLAHLVYVDAVVPQDGESLFDHCPEDYRASWLANLMADGWRVAAGPHTDAWISERLTPQPLATLTQPIRLDDPAPRPIARTYIRCIKTPHPAVARSVERIRREPGWQLRDLVSEHAASLTAPFELAKLLLEVATLKE
jgi:pimeloyl-ACP methyl ester carboxylesterase